MPTTIVGWGNIRNMRTNRRLVGAIFISLLVHGWLLTSYFPEAPPVTDPVVLDVVLQQPPEDLHAPVDAEPLAEELVPATRPLAETPLAVVDEIEEVVHPEVPIVALPSPTVLNLERPMDWDEIVNSVPAMELLLPFTPGLSRRVALRDGERQRQRLVGVRAAAVYGVSNQAYDRQGALGREMKLDGRCYVLVENPSVESGDRWWASQCKDTRTAPLRLDPIEYDAIGRAIVEPERMVGSE